MVSLSFCSDRKTRNQRSPTGNTSTEKENKVPEKRKSIRKEAVARYRERTENPLNEWYFGVDLFETKNTFHYLIKLQYEEIRGIDTLRLPDFGQPPSPVLKKGPEKYSCIIGFLDNNDSFRVYKKVYVRNNTLKITALRHYAVSTREIIKN
ncbi:MAG TPA: hypothetical protein VM012_12550 [Flavitalea sp.]|nr:hypothetical protein [Flavitalea sp.]